MRLLDAANNTGCIRKEERRYAQDGRGKQSLRTLPLVILVPPILEKGGTGFGWKRIST